MNLHALGPKPSDFTSLSTPVRGPRAWDRTTDRRVNGPLLYHSATLGLASVRDFETPTFRMTTGCSASELHGHLVAQVGVEPTKPEGRCFTDTLLWPLAYWTFLVPPVNFAITTLCSSDRCSTSELRRYIKRPLGDGGLVPFGLEFNVLRVRPDPHAREHQIDNSGYAETYACTYYSALCTTTTNKTANTAPTAIGHGSLTLNCVSV